MKHPTRSVFILPSVTAVLSIWLLGSGCKPSEGQQSLVAQLTTNQARLASELEVAANRLSVWTNQWAQSQSNQQAVARALEEKLALLERQHQQQLTALKSDQTDRSEARRVTQVQSEQAQKLQERIQELEAKLKAVESGRVLPEIAVTAEDGPTTRELEQQIKVAERNREIAQEASEARSKEAPRLSAGAGGLSFASGDSNFVFKIRGMVQTDAQVFLDDNPLLQGNDGFYLRRVRTAFQGTLFKDLDYLIVPQYGGLGQDTVQILDATFAYKLGNFEVRAGKFKGPVGLELLQGISVLQQSERSLVSDLVPQRQVGVQFSGKLWNETVSYAAGVFNNAGDQRNPGNFDFTDDKEFAGRVFLNPFARTSVDVLKGLSFGLGASYSQVSSNALGLPRAQAGGDPGYFTTPGNQQFFAYNPIVGPVVADGAHWRLSPQGTFYYGPFGLMGEYIISSQGVYNSTTFRSAELAHQAWQLGAEWVLTGESASFNGIQPNRPFSLHGAGWGAWQLVGRYSQFDVDDEAFPAFSNPLTSGTGATSWSVGLNWWLNRNLRILTSFTHTSFDGGGAVVNLADPSTITAPSTVTAQEEKVVSTRVQVSF